MDKKRSDEPSELFQAPMPKKPEKKEDKKDNIEETECFEAKKNIQRRKKGTLQKYDDQLNMKKTDLIDETLEVSK